MDDWSGTVYGPITPRPRKRSTPGAPAAASSSKRATTTSKAPAPAKTTSTPAKRAPRKTTAATATKPTVDVVLGDVSMPIPEPAASTFGPAASETVAELAPLWTLLVADPALAPEHLARQAVRQLGPQAREWVDRTRERYPRARPDALARLATQEHIRIARRQAMANTTALGAWAEVGLLGRTQARLVLTIAAAYGADPMAEDRVQDLMELLPIPRLMQAPFAAAAAVGRLLGAVAVRRVGAQLMPFGAAVTGAIHSGRTTQDLATRAINRFRPPSPNSEQ